MTDTNHSLGNLNDLLSGFTGTEGYTKHFTGKLFTDGVEHLAENYQTYWLLDLIFSLNKPEPIDEFQVWKLQRVSGNTFSLTADDGNDNILYTQEIPFSDFPGDSVELYYADNVLYLPSEH